MNDSQKLDMLLEAMGKLTQDVAGIRKDLSKTMIDVETLKDDQKAVIEGQQTVTVQLERKIDEAVEKINTRDDIQDKAIYKLVQVK